MGDQKLKYVLKFCIRGTCHVISRTRNNDSTCASVRMRFEGEYRRNRYWWRLVPKDHQQEMAYVESCRMVTWPILSRDSETSRSWPNMFGAHYLKTGSLEWRDHSQTVDHCTTCYQSRVREWFHEKCMSKLLPKRSEWRCTDAALSDSRQQDVPCLCSWHRERSITQRWTTRRRYNQRHGIGGAKISLSVHITDQL